MFIRTNAMSTEMQTTNFNPKGKGALHLLVAYLFKNPNQLFQTLNPTVYFRQNIDSNTQNSLYTSQSNPTIFHKP